MNERLRLAMTQRGITPDALAAACDVDPKTVSRWLAGRIPHPRHRWTAAQLLAADTAALWPAEAATADAASTSATGLAFTYPDRASVPRDLWLHLLQHAERHVDVLVYSGTFFAQTNPQVASMLSARSRAGCRIRLCFADPAGTAVAHRDKEEGLGGTLAAKIRASLTYYRVLVREPGCEVRLHNATVYASLFRYDDDLLTNPHIWGSPASANPVLHLRGNRDAADWFHRYTESFDAVWSTARPWDGTLPSTGNE